MAQQRRGKSRNYILRGPFLVSAVCLSLITPYLSTTTLVHLAIAAVGVLCFFHDLISYLESQVKVTLHQFLDGLVLDDLLRAFYDPENGLIPFLVGGFMGSSSMYGLRLNEEQKTRLVQASLSINYDQANSLLMSPGGCKAWLPPAIQTWLDNQTKQIKAIEYEEVDEAASVDIIPASPASSEPYVQESSDSSEDTNNSSSQRGTSTSSESSCKHEFSFENPPMDTPTDPLSEMFTIIRGLAFERMKPYIQSIPESMLENVGMSAIAILGLQLGFRKRTQSTLRFICNTALSGVATGTISTVVARRMILDNESFQTIIKTVTLRTWQKIKSSALCRKRWQSTLAMIVLLVLGRRERQRGASNIFQR